MAVVPTVAIELVMKSRRSILSGDITAAFRQMDAIAQMACHFRVAAAEQLWTLGVKRFCAAGIAKINRM
jgi:hypothetical protein